MAARKQLWHPDEVRQKIQTSQLINRLHKHAFGEVEMTSTQVDAAKTLLKKSIPDLSSVQVAGMGEKGEHLHKVVLTVVDPKS